MPLQSSFEKVLPFSLMLVASLSGRRLHGDLYSGHGAILHFAVGVVFCVVAVGLLREIVKRHEPLEESHF